MLFKLSVDPEKTLVIVNELGGDVQIPLDKLLALITQTAGPLTVTQELTVEGSQLVIGNLVVQGNIVSPGIIAGTQIGCLDNDSEDPDRAVGYCLMAVNPVTATLSGASTAISLGIPADCKLLGLAYFVVEDIVLDSGTSVDLSFTGGNTTQVVSGSTALTEGSQVKAFIDSSIGSDITTAITNAIITPDVGNFTSGKISIFPFYYKFNLVIN